MDATADKGITTVVWANQNSRPIADLLTNPISPLVLRFQRLTQYFDQLKWTLRDQIASNLREPGPAEIKTADHQSDQHIELLTNSE